MIFAGISNKCPREGGGDLEKTSNEETRKRCTSSVALISPRRSIVLAESALSDMYTSSNPSAKSIKNGTISQGHGQAGFKGLFQTNGMQLEVVICCAMQQA
jgi:hypothetical protein